MKIRFEIGEKKAAAKRNTWDCFSLGGDLVDLACNIDEAKHAVWKNRPDEAAIGLEGVSMRALDVKRLFPEMWETAQAIHDRASALAKELMNREEPFSYEEQRDAEMAVLSLDEMASRLLSDARELCKTRK